VERERERFSGEWLCGSSMANIDNLQCEILVYKNWSLPIQKKKFWSLSH